MSFTIRCDKCGNEQTFKDGDKRFQENIKIHLEEDCDYMGCTVEGILIYCGNDKCNHFIDIEY